MYYLYGWFRCQRAQVLVQVMRFLLDSTLFEQLVHVHRRRMLFVCILPLEVEAVSTVRTIGVVIVVQLLLCCYVIVGRTALLHDH